MRFVYVFLTLLSVQCNLASYIALRQLVQGNHVSEARFANFKAQMKHFKIPYEVVIGRKYSNRLEGLNNDLLNMVAKLRSSNYEQGIICEDDAHFHPNFVDELDKTVKAAGNYTILALCTGNLWGRVTGPKEPFGTLVYDDPIINDETDPTGRVYRQWPRFKTRFTHGSHAIWPGAPMCVLVRNQPAVLDSITAKIRKSMLLPPDLYMRDLAIATPTMKMVAFPQLCRELELGKV
jgi:hypothetical protein